MSDLNEHGNPDPVLACPYTKVHSIRVNYPGELDENTQYQLWLERVKEYVSKRCDSTKRHRLYVYHHDGTSHVAFDILHEDRSKDITITIAVTSGYCGLPRPIQDQIDFELPDLVSVMDFINHIIHCDHKDINHINGRCLLELFPWDRPTEKPLAPGL